MYSIKKNDVINTKKNPYKLIKIRNIRVQYPESEKNITLSLNAA